MHFRLGELFCGPGGLALAAQSVRLNTGAKEFLIKHAWTTDADPAACRTYAANITGDARGVASVDEFNRGQTACSVICGDVRKLEIEKLPAIDCLAFGFPCNDYSYIGEQRGLDGVYGPLFSYGVRVLEVQKPIWFLAENVKGIQNSNGGRALREILARLATAGVGYNLSVHTYRFEQYGVPQTRSRVIIVGTRKDQPFRFRVPVPTHSEPKSVRDALEKPPIPNWAPNQERTRQSPKVVERLRFIPPGRNAWHNDVPEHLRLNVKGATLSQIYRRLDPDRPSYTITGSGGGGTHVYHWNELRALTNRERARIQTFPDDFRFEGTKEAVRRQIGMAVPPDGAAPIFEAILKTCAGLSYRSVPDNMAVLDDAYEQPLLFGR